MPKDSRKEESVIFLTSFHDLVHKELLPESVGTPSQEEDMQTTKREAKQEQKRESKKSSIDGVQVRCSTPESNAGKNYTPTELLGRWKETREQFNTVTEEEGKALDGIRGFLEELIKEIQSQLVAQGHQERLEKAENEARAEVGQPAAKIDETKANIDLKSSPFHYFMVQHKEFLAHFA